MRQIVAVAGPADGPVITGYAGPRRSVLVVDDIPFNRAMLCALLQPIGFAVIEAADGAQAVRQAESAPPDLVLLDWRMPNMDGAEALRRLRQLPALKDTVIIVVSASMLDLKQC